MTDSTLPLSALQQLPPTWPAELMPFIRQQVRDSRRTLVVLDDDPTGTQTVHSVPVLTHWPVDALAQELRTAPDVFYILTNSRSLPLEAAQALNQQIGHNLYQASLQTGQDFALVSRSDSTLRGHFPGEVAALAETLPTPFDAWLVIPYFREGGRFTLHDVHYVAEGDRLVPAAQTPFAQDAAFGYQASNLRQWIAEKTAGRVPADAVASISLDALRSGGPEVVYKQLCDLHPGQIAIVNAAADRDLEVLVTALLRAEAEGRRYLYRTAASFVRVRAGLASRPLLQPSDFAAAGGSGGLTVVGSYVPKTTQQLAVLLQQPNLVSVEVQVDALLNPAVRSRELDRAAAVMNQALQAGHDVVLWTSRTLITGADAAASLAIGASVSNALIALVQRLQQRPRYLIAKGGITSSDVATQGLGVQRALVLGQVLPGIPAWQTGPETRFPGLPYIVFPGNVGGADALAEVVALLRG